MKKKNEMMDLEQFKEKHYGKRGTEKREVLEKGFESFKLGAILLEARKEKGMTQDELARKVGTTKSYISKIENNVKEARLSTLQKIVELGLDGQLEIFVKL